MSVPLFVATLERTGCPTHLVGVFTSELAAYRETWKIELLKNAEYDIGGAGKEGNEYLALYTKLDTLKAEDLEVMKKKWEEEREAYLGEGESSGDRTIVQEINALDVVVLELELEWRQAMEKRLLEELAMSKEENLRNMMIQLEVVREALKRHQDHELAAALNHRIEGHVRLLTGIIHRQDHSTLREMEIAELEMQLNNTTEFAKKLGFIV